MDSQPGIQAEQLLDKTAKWSETFYDKGRDYVENMLKALGEDCNRIVYIEYNYHQIGKSEEWFREISAKINDPLTVRREILLQRLHGSSLSPYNQEDIEYIVSTEQKPIDEMWLMDYYKFDIYEKLDKNIPYLIGVDCATGTNQDNNAITILHPYTVKPVAEFECPFIGETLFEELLKELISILPKAVLCIERNNVGDGIIDHLLHSNISHRIYFDKALELLKEQTARHNSVESMLKKNMAQKTYYGVWTGKESRETMFMILSDRVFGNKEDFVTHNIIRDLSRLVLTKSGKIAAGSGFHDDSIMSYLIVLYVYYFGNNLGAFGINKGMDPDFVPNQGMKQPEEINKDLVDPRLIEEAIIKIEQEKKKYEWSNMMQQAIEKSQRQSYLESKAGLSNNIYNDSSEIMVYDNDFSNIDLDFFDEINGLDSKNDANMFDGLF